MLFDKAIVPEHGDIKGYEETIELLRQYLDSKGFSLEIVVWTRSRKSSGLKA